MPVNRSLLSFPFSRLLLLLLLFLRNQMNQRRTNQTAKPRNRIQLLVRFGSQFAAAARPMLCDLLVCLFISCVSSWTHADFKALLSVHHQRPAARAIDSLKRSYPFCGLGTQSAAAFHAHAFQLPFKVWLVQALAPNVTVDWVSTRSYNICVISAHT